VPFHLAPCLLPYLDPRSFGSFKSSRSRGTTSGSWFPVGNGHAGGGGGAAKHERARAHQGMGIARPEVARGGFTTRGHGVEAARHGRHAAWRWREVGKRCTRLVERWWSCRWWRLGVRESVAVGTSGDYGAWRRHPWRLCSGAARERVRVSREASEGRERVMEAWGAGYRPQEGSDAWCQGGGTKPCMEDASIIDRTRGMQWHGHCGMSFRAPSGLISTLGQEAML
jgi:hypothetical protein